MLSEKRRGLRRERILRKPTVRLRHEENCDKAFRVARGHDTRGRGGGGVFWLNTKEEDMMLKQCKM